MRSCNLRPNSRLSCPYSDYPKRRRTFCKDALAIYFFGPLWFALFMGGLFLLQTVAEHLGAVTRDRYPIAWFGYIFGMSPSVFFFGMARTRLEEEESPPTSAAAASDPVNSGAVRGDRDRRGWSSRTKDIGLQQIAQLDALCVSGSRLAHCHGKHFSKTQEMTEAIDRRPLPLY